MPANLDYVREYAGGADDQMLVADISPTALTFSLDGVTGWPSGSHPFVVTINPGGDTEEKVLCSSRTGNAVTVQNRGYDGTTASNHSATEIVRHTISAIDFSIFNQHTSSAAGVHGVSGNVVGDTDTQTLANKTLSSPIIDNVAGVDFSAATGVMRTPSQTLQAHFGTVSLSPGGSAIAFPHGAPFTPVTGFVSGGANVSFTSLNITSYGPTNLTVAFSNSNAALSVATCQISYVVFG
jgi:hypothetical protein